MTTARPAAATRCKRIGRNPSASHRHGGNDDRDFLQHGFTQQQLNDLANKERLDLVRVPLGEAHEILSLDLVTQDEVVATPWRACFRWSAVAVSCEHQHACGYGWTSPFPPKTRPRKESRGRLSAFRVDENGMRSGVHKPKYDFPAAFAEHMLQWRRYGGFRICTAQRTDRFASGSSDFDYR
jgi:hypothetical protein